MIWQFFLKLTPNPSFITLFVRRYSTMSEMRVQGTVRWFSRVKGYGFIQPDGQEDDVFVHYSAILGEGYRNLQEGQRVEFAIEDSPKGPQAIEVTDMSFGKDILN
jgi:CspA family cold shock protein